MDSIQLPIGSTEAPVQTQPAGDPPQRPDSVPEKFWKDGKVDTDSLLKSYTELEGKLGQPKPEPKPETKPEPKPGETKPEPTPQEGDFKPFYEEFAKDGKLSEESYKKLAEAHKLPKEVVDSFIKDRLAAQEASSNQLTKVAFEATGGEENYRAMQDWGRDNLNPSEIAAFNEATASGDPGKISLAVAGLYQKYTTAEGGPAPERIRGEKGGSNVTPFRSSDEIVTAMRDPRYATSPTYREEVERRIAQSDF